MLNRYDQQRKQSLIKAIQKAVVRVKECRLYLTARDGDECRDELWRMGDVNEHLDNALAILGAEDPR